MKEVQFRDLKIGENYFIQEAPLIRIGGKGRAKGINYLGSENFSFDRHTVGVRVRLWHPGGEGEEGRMAEKTILRKRIQAQKIGILNRVHAR